MIGWGNGLPGIPAGFRRRRISTLPGLVARYRRGESGGWPDVIGGVGDGVHTGAPSTAADGGAVGMSYDGATQYTTIGDATDLAFIHQTWAFAVSAWFKWGGPAAGTALECIVANSLGSANKGFSLFVDDGGSSGGPLGLAAQMVRGQTGVLTRLDSAINAITIGQLHHALVTCDGATARLFLDGAEVDSAAAVATATGDSTYATRIGDTEAATPTFALAGDVLDVLIGTEDLSSYAAAIYAAGPGAP